MVPAPISSKRGPSNQQSQLGDWANGIWKKEQKGGKRKGGCLKATGAELWLQPPWKCSSQQGVILRNFRKNMSYLACAPAESAAPAWLAQTQPNTGKIHQHCNL